jgi:hypothetical protein
MTKLVRFDWAMKYLLRNKANFDILEGFLSELLKIDIHIETVLESESNKNYADDKFNRVDLLVKTARGEHIIIEVQCSNQWDYLSRVLYGTSKAVCEYMREGDAYRQIRKVISVSIVFFDLGEGKDYLYRGSTVFKGLHCHDTLHLNAKEQDVYGEPNGLVLQTPEEIFPEYYIIKVTAFAERVKNKFDEWVYFLKHGKIEKEFVAQGIQSAAHKLDMLQLSESERRKYEKFRESLHDNASWAEMITITEAKAAKAEAEAVQSTSEKIALRLLKKGMSDEEIVEMTDLSIEKVKGLRQQAT